MGADDELRQEEARLLVGATGGRLEVVRAYPGNADAWESLWLADQAIESAGEQELAELNTAKL